MSNFNLNRVVLAGRLTSDVELRQTTTGVSICTFTLSVRRKFVKDTEPATDFIKCQAWRGTAEFISRYFEKGSALCITGSIQTRSWTNQKGQRQYATEVVADDAMFVDGKNDVDEPSVTTPYIPEAYTKPTTQDHPKEDDDLPF